MTSQHATAAEGVDGHSGDFVPFEHILGANPYGRGDVIDPFDYILGGNPYGSYRRWSDVARPTTTPKCVSEKEDKKKE